MNPDLTGITRSLERLVTLQQKGPWDYIATIAVVLTLGVLVLYTIETYRLRKAAQAQTTETTKLLREAQRQNQTSVLLLEQAHRQNETAIMPILAIRVEPPQSRYARSNLNEIPHLVLRNEGTGPAFNASIEAYSEGDRVLEFDHGSPVIRPGEERELTYHLQEGNSGTVGNVNELYSWINSGKLPDPMFVTMRCQSVSSTGYTFIFKFTPVAGALAVWLEGMDSKVALTRMSAVNQAVDGAAS